MAGMRKPAKKRPNPRPNKGIGGMPGGPPPMTGGPAPMPGQGSGLGGGMRRPTDRNIQSPGLGWGPQQGWQQRGFDSKAAAKSAFKQYGFVDNPEGGFMRPDMAFLERQMASQGWGPDQTAQTPVGIGGARWMMGAGGPQFTGQQSDLAGGQAYDSAQQMPYGQRRPRRQTQIGGSIY